MNRENDCRDTSRADEHKNCTLEVLVINIRNSIRENFVSSERNSDVLRRMLFVPKLIDALMNRRD